MVPIHLMAQDIIYIRAVEQVEQKWIKNKNKKDCTSSSVQSCWHSSLLPTSPGIWWPGDVIEHSDSLDGARILIPMEHVHNNGTMEQWNMYITHSFWSNKKNPPHSPAGQVIRGALPTLLATTDAGFTWALVLNLDKLHWCFCGALN